MHPHVQLVFGLNQIDSVCSRDTSLCLLRESYIVQYMESGKGGLWAFENNNFPILHTEHSQSTLIQTMCMKQDNAF